jgi:hypothetical protein
VNRRAHCFVIALCTLSLTAVSASAQSWEIAGLAGFTPAVSLEHQAPELSDLRIRGGSTWGIGATRFFTPHWGAELMWTRQASALQAETSRGSADLYQMTLRQLQGNLVYQFGEGTARWRPFVLGGAGATFFSAPDLESSTKASFGIGGGIKYFPWRAVGVRAQVRYTPTLLNDDLEGGVCDPFGFCQGSLRPINVAAGVTIRF